MFMKYKKRNIMFIHGAWSSCQSFNYLSRRVDNELDRYIKDTIFFEYNTIKDPIDNIVRRAIKEISKDDTETLVIGHSMGGLVALVITDQPNCYRTITLASPLSGIKIKKVFQPFIYARAPILAELSPDSTFIKNLPKRKYTKRVDCLITTKGFNPLMMEKSDGVVTVYSQERWMPETALPTYVENNHYEILQSDQAFSTIKKALISQ